MRLDMHSVERVMKALEEAGEPVTREQLENLTGLCGRTMRAALQRLHRTGAVDSRRMLADTRRSIYFLRKDPPVRDISQHLFGTATRLVED